MPRGHYDLYALFQFLLKLTTAADISLLHDFIDHVHNRVENSLEIRWQLSWPRFSLSCLLAPTVEQVNERLRLKDEECRFGLAGQLSEEFKLKTSSLDSVMG